MLFAARNVIWVSAAGDGVSPTKLVYLFFCFFLLFFFFWKFVSFSLKEEQIVLYFGSISHFPPNPGIATSAKLGDARTVISRSRILLLSTCPFKTRSHPPNDSYSLSLSLSFSLALIKYADPAIKRESASNFALISPPIAKISSPGFSDRFAFGFLLRSPDLLRLEVFWFRF